MKKLIGKCKNCLGCNRLEDPNFTGVYRCEYSTEEEEDDSRRGIKNNT